MFWWFFDFDHFDDLREFRIMYPMYFHIVSSLAKTIGMPLRTEVRDDFNILGARYFGDAVFCQKSKIYDVVSLLYLKY